MMRLSNRVAVSLQDLVNTATVKTASYMGISYPTFPEFISGFGYELDPGDIDFWINKAKGTGFDLWQSIYFRYHDMFVFFIDYHKFGVSIDEALDPKRWISFVADYFREFMIRFLSILSQTRNRYEILIGEYDKQKSSLMNQLKTSSTTKSRFNDVPQEKLDYQSDDYATNASIGESESFADTTTPILRLKEIEINYSNIIKDWTSEFEGLFIEPLNYEEI